MSSLIRSQESILRNGSNSLMFYSKIHVKCDLFLNKILNLDDHIDLNITLTTRKTTITILTVLKLTKFVI